MIDEVIPSRAMAHLMAAVVAANPGLEKPLIEIAAKVDIEDVSLPRETLLVELEPLRSQLQDAVSEAFVNGYSEANFPKEERDFLGL